MCPVPAGGGVVDPPPTGPVLPSLAAPHQPPGHRCTTTASQPATVVERGASGGRPFKGLGISWFMLRSDALVILRVLVRAVKGRREWRLGESPWDESIGPRVAPLHLVLILHWRTNTDLWSGSLIILKPLNVNTFSPNIIFRLHLDKFYFLVLGNMISLSTSKHSMVKH